MEQDKIYQAMRRQLVFDELQIIGGFNKEVLYAMSKVPRHEFVPEEAKHLAYENTALPIGYGQTISQPLIVAEMTQAAKLDEKSRVLEIGTGSGYQAAVLANICKEVYSVEVIEPLAKQAAQVLQKLGYDNIHIRAKNGYNGWQEKAPFDAIIATAAAREAPKPLLEQLKVGGRLVIPLGEPYNQELVVITKTQAGFERKSLLPVLFVPFV